MQWTYYWPNNTPAYSLPLIVFQTRGQFFKGKVESKYSTRSTKLAFLQEDGFHPNTKEVQGQSSILQISTDEIGPSTIQRFSLGSFIPE